jgi:hypothetical protein
VSRTVGAGWLRTGHEIPQGRTVEVQPSLLSDELLVFRDCFA